MGSLGEQHRSRSIRLKGYDYAQPGAYFVTICARDRQCVFGAVTGGQMALSSLGNIVQACWSELPSHYPYLELDAFVAMPNHVHGVVAMHDVGAGFKPAPTLSASTGRHGLPEIVRAFKTFSSRRINELRGTPGTPLWQRGYYEHVIRDEADLQRVRDYILGNPTQWAVDPENPECQRGDGSGGTSPRNG